MGFFDLNIPYQESDRHATDISSLRGRRLKLALKAMELGYTGVAYNRTLKGVMSESDRCSITLFPLSKLTTSTSSSFFAAVKFHRDLLNVAVSSPFRQYTRLTVIVDSPSQASALNSGNPILRSYDFIAVRPMNQNAFDQACQTSEVDMISIDFSEKLPFRLKQHMVKAAIKRGVYFEITYCGLISDAQSRRQMISNCKLLVDWTRGKNLIFCSSAASASDLRGPQDVANLSSLLGLTMERAKAAVTHNCRSLLTKALRKKHFYKEAVRVEEIPSGGQVNPAQSAFDDWLKWDPISSGGDLLLDEMEKSFVIPNTVSGTSKTINFTTYVNGMPAHGLEIKDLLSITGAALEQPPGFGKLPAATEKDPLEVCEKPEEQGDPNSFPEQSSLPESQGRHNTVSNEQEGVDLLPEGQISLHGLSNVELASGHHDSNVSLDTVSEGLVVPLFFPEESHRSFKDEKIRFQAPHSEDIEMSSLPAYTDASINSEVTVSVSSEKLNHSDDLETDFVASETLLNESELSGENASSNGGQVHKQTKAESTATSDSNGSIQHFYPLSKCSFSTFQSEENKVETEFKVPRCAQKTMATDKDVCKSTQGPFSVPLDASVQDVYVGEQKKTADSYFKLVHGLPFNEVLNMATESNGPIGKDVVVEKHTDSVASCQYPGKPMAGRGKRRRNPHQHFLFPFKHFVNPSPFKRKARK